MNSIDYIKLHSENSLKTWYALPINERNTLNSVAIKEKVLQWDQLLELQQSGKELSLDNHLVFFHIFKTAGTTLNRIIAKNYRINNLIQANAPVIDANPSILFKLGSCIRVLMGHFELNDLIYQVLDRRQLIHITLLREPLERIVSYFDHIQSRERHILHEHVKDMSLADFIASDLVNEVSNGQSHRLLGLLKQKQILKDYRSENQLLSDAKDMLIKKFSIVGTTDQFDQFLLQCHSLLNWPDIYYQRLNQSAKKTVRKELPVGLVNKVYALNQVDLKLYNFIKSLNQKRCETLKIDKLAVNNFTNSNKKINQIIDTLYGLKSK